VNPQKGSLENKTSFYYPLLLLPPSQRRAMELLYRFCWEADEIADGPGSPAEKKHKLSRFKRNLKGAFQGRARDGLFQKLQGLIPAFHLSKEPLERIVAGVERDLRPIRFQKFQELHRYALQVAGGPGLACMEIFGFKDKAHRDYAENLGVFLQLVNIARDYREDMAVKRQYFPLEDFKRFHLNPAQLEETNSHWKPFVEFQLDRAWSFLEKARRSLSRPQRAQLATAEAIAAVYVKLYQKLRANPYRILKGRTGLSKADKLVSVLGTLGRCWLWKWTTKSP
jgi:phytoene/squalene synthetase